MTTDSYQFREYGDGGDQVGSYRARRAFRLMVVAFVLFITLLWFAEQFLQYEQAERLYISALTLEDPSARALLRQAARFDEKKSFPSPRILQALAEREEPDLVLDTYKKAYALGNPNMSLLVRYGLKLASFGHIDEARTIFQEAASLDEENALPLYLEAAILPWKDPANPDLWQSMALIARANSSGKRVKMPRPVWHADLPTGGYWYAGLQRNIIAECILPVEEFVAFVSDTAQQQINEGRMQYWDSWLEKIQVMGRRLLLDAAPEDPAAASPGASLQALSGIRIQIEALRLREKLREKSESGTDETLVERRTMLESFVQRLASFTAERNAVIDASITRFVFPLRLAKDALIVAFSVFFASCIVAWAFAPGRTCWTIPHPLVGKVLLIGGAVVILIGLLIVMPFQRWGQIDKEWYHYYEWAFDILLALYFFLGAIYAVFALPCVRKACEKVESPPETEQPQITARRKRFIASVALFRRYCGVATGLILISLCIWSITHRAIIRLYPWELKLLTPGLGLEEVQLVRSVLEHIN